MQQRYKHGNSIYLYTYNPKWEEESLSIATGNSEHVVDSIGFYRTCDYGFNAYDFNDMDVELEEKEFIYTIDDPIYLPLLHLLNGDLELIIEDDFTLEDRKKYMVIKNNNDNIIVKFINKTNDRLDQFSVNIKNIMYDGRSKIDRDELDTKDRLYYFFNELHDEFINEYHQMTIEEYTLKKKRDV